MIGKRLAVAAALMATFGLIMLVAVKRMYPLEPRFHYEIGDPILALEFAHNADDIRTVLPGSNYAPSERERTLRCRAPEHARPAGVQDLTECPDWDADARRAIFWNTVLDLFFIPLYVCFLVVLSRSISDAANFRRAILALSTVAGLFDYVEDGLIFAALRGAAPAIYLPSLAKWVCIGLALVLIAFRLMSSHRRLYSVATDRLLGLEYLVAGGSMLTGAALGEWLGAILIRAWGSDRGQQWGYGLIQAGAFVWALLVVVIVLHEIIFRLRALLKPDLVRYVENFCDPARPHAPEEQAIREVS